MISPATPSASFRWKSRAQAQILPQPANRARFDDLIVSISLIRPGPVQGDMVHPYLRRRRGAEPVSYLHPLLEPALAETLGVILFQEQVLKVARDLAGFTPGQGELLRRALGGKRAAEETGRAQRRVRRRGGRDRACPKRPPRRSSTSCAPFGGYSFPKATPPPSPCWSITPPG